MRPSIKPWMKFRKSQIESLESRFLLAFGVSTFDPVSSSATFVGDLAGSRDDSLELGEVAGFVTHNASVGNYANSLDFDPGPGTVNIPSNGTTLISVLAADGTDSVTILNGVFRTEAFLGDGNDFFDASNLTDGSVVVHGERGDDQIRGTSAPGPSVDRLIGGDGDDILEGLAGDDELFGGDGRDQLLGGLGNDILEGGADSDVISAGSGVDDVDGGSGDDSFVFEAGGGEFQIAHGLLPGSVSVVASSGSGTGFSGASNVEELRLVTTSETSSDFLIADLNGSTIREIQVDLASGLSDGESVVIEGSDATETITLSSTPEFGGDIPSVVMGWGSVLVSDTSSGVIQVNGNGGDDSLKIADFPAGSIDLILSGGDGDDIIGFETLSAVRAGGTTLIGGNGNDRLEGSAGDDVIEGSVGDDEIVSGLGDDSIDGGADFDTILVNGTPGEDLLTVTQSSGTSFIANVNSISDTDTLILGSVESIRVNAGSGNDTVEVTQNDGLTTAESLRFEVLGGDGLDRLFVVDDAAGDLAVLRQGTNRATGSYSIGILSTVAFSSVEYSDVTPKSGITSGTGSDEDGRFVVFKTDEFENNNSLPNAAHLGGGEVVNLSSVIDPGAEFDGVVPADVDWFQLVAARTGTVDVRLLFEQIGTLDNGNAGLPGEGDLNLSVFDANGNLLGSSSTNTNNERFAFPAVQDSTYFVSVAGATTDAINTFDLTVENEAAPVPNVVDLIASDDSGRHSDDDVTNVANSSFDIYLDDDRLDSFTNLDLVADTTNNDAQDADADYGVEVFNNDVSIGFAFLTGDGNRWRFTADAGDLQEGPNNFLSSAVWIRDRSTPTNVDRGDLGEVLKVTLDTTAPDVPTVALDPAVTDSGISTDLTTLADRITNQSTPGFLGTAEADSIVRLFANGEVSAAVLGIETEIGLTVAFPVDGNSAFPDGQYRATSTVNLNDGFPRDGLRRITATAEDLAGNVSQTGALDILLDTTPPQIVGVDFPNSTTVFASKPDLQPSPAVDSLLVTFAGGPVATIGLSSPAVDLGLAADVRNYQLSGDQTGNVLIDNALIVSSSPTEVVVRIQFSDLLADDRYTLTLDDSISDAAGNLLDGDSSAQAPGTPVIVLPSGNGIVGGDFVARFTVDSRPEFGTVSQGLVYVDINGNHVFDPEGQDNDATNRDFVMQFGQLVDAHFTGNFADTATGVASGFDKLGSYGRFNGTYSFLIDTNDDGVGDFASLMPSGFQVNGIPVAGDFNAGNDGDEIGLFDGEAWYLDNNGNNRIDAGERIAANYNGLPIVGDFNGDGNDDLAVYVNDTNQFIFDTNRDGRSNFTWDASDDVGRFGGLSGFTDRPVAGDVNLDGIDDIGLWVKGRQGVLPKESGEFFFWVSDQVNNNPANVFDAYSPAPLGNDAFAQFGDETALPIFGNFDPPVATAVDPTNRQTLTNAQNAYDVNNDGNVTALDALVVINALSRGIEDVQPSQAARVFAVTGNFLDVDGSEKVSALDALMIINHMSRQSAGTGEGEVEPASNYQAIDDVMSESDEEETWLEADLDSRIGLLS